MMPPEWVGRGAPRAIPLDSGGRGWITMYSLDERVVGRARGAVDCRPAATSRRAVMALVVMGVTVVLGVAAAPAGAKVVTNPITHHKFGVVPTTTAAPSLAAACTADNTDCTRLTYHGGAVQHAEKNYLLFWTPSGHGLPSAYKAG